MTTATFSVRNYEQFQHYKDRNPVWIKLYNSLLEDYEFGLLPDASKAHLIAIFLLASRYKNKIPMDGNWVARKISATTTVDLTLLEKAGFIQFNQDCSNLLANCYHSAIPEKRREEGEIEKNRGDIGASQAKPPKATVRKSRTRLPENFPLQSDLDWATEKWLGKGRTDLCGQIAEEAAKFRDHHSAKATASADWPASWRTWATNAMNFTKRVNGNGKHTPTAHDKFFAAGESLIREILGEAGDGDDSPPADAAGYQLLPP